MRRAAYRKLLRLYPRLVQKNGGYRLGMRVCGKRLDGVTMNETSISKAVRITGNIAVERQTSAFISNTIDENSRLRQALADAGVLSLDQQAKSLGVSRSTAWAVLKGNHKSYGLSATLINRMLASPQLPRSARKIILEYVEEKSAGAYGHGKEPLRQFRARLANGHKFQNLSQ